MGLILFPTSFASGTGFEIKNSCELQIIAKIGKPERLGGKGGKPLLHGHIIAQRREHSRKPDCARDEIASLFAGPRAELFARSHHPGFEVWGNQTNMFDGGAS